MIHTRITKDYSGKIDLCETYSDDKNCIGFLQLETSRTYYENPIDTIVGYDEDGFPYSQYTYEEILKPEPEEGGVS